MGCGVKGRMRVCLGAAFLFGAALSGIPACSSLLGVMGCLYPTGVSRGTRPMP